MAAGAGPCSRPTGGVGIRCGCFGALFGLSLGAEFIANDRPIVIAQGGEWRFPVFFTYTERELGGVLETEADYRDPYVMALIEADGWMLWPIVRYAP